MLRWPVAEAAELLDTSVAAVNSALQRARATLARPARRAASRRRSTTADAELLERYVDAFERYDIERLVTLLHEDAVQSMPPFAMWIQGAADIGRWMVEPGTERLPGLAPAARPRPTAARRSGSTGRTRPAATRRGRCRCSRSQADEITGMSFFLAFLDPERLFPEFGLPLHLDA